MTDQHVLLEPGTPVNLENCHREPIRTPGGIQSHGALLAADEHTLEVVQASSNAAQHFGRPVLGALLADLLGADVIEPLRARAEEATPNLRPLRVRGLDVYAYRAADNVLVVEIEPVGPGAASLTRYQEDVARALTLLQHAPAVDELLWSAARIVRDLTGSDRVWVYRFEADDHGVIVAEEKREGLDAFLHLHYPAGDIPPQARALFLQNRLRFIHDVQTPATPLEPLVNPLTGEWLDLSGGVLRAVSPIHIRYLKNMGATASMSIALSVGGRLWGLISGHHYSGPLFVPHEVRATCELIGIVCSMQLDALEQLEVSRRQTALGTHRSAVLDRVAASSSILDGLEQAGEELLAVCDAEGAAIRIDGDLRLVGETPEDVAGILDGLEGADVFATDSFEGPMPGVLAAPLAVARGNHVVWFRSEYVHEIEWAHAPKSLAVKDPDRLNPDGSFRTWAESVEGRSRPWTTAEIESVAELRSALGTFLITRAEQLAALNAELARSNEELDAFAYVAAHDLKEPLRGISNFTTFLVEDYEDALDAEARERLATIHRLSQRMASLLDSLLEYSRIGRADLDVTDFTVGDVLEDALDLLATKPAITVSGADMPLRGDRIRVRQALVNLLGNAVKYSPDEPRISVTARDGVVCVSDNGIGIAPEHHDSIFHVFRRLHARDAYGGGTGAGLTIARRIAERHGGRLWLERSVPGEGSSFCFTLEGD
ncbi:GAF domain-containing protein [Solirubrobacter sp. CPCC 204708]|uniref:Sensor-like histidine kinase SenX3 n=1 Tax=Solirubrobacter deserti TaxID=2282478 RepID=A0ABT4RHQ1_9ACTN|nr:ATP-binding protein [Solirubrobacter deserti]MBE2316533.1 GAF domain-containing protein [Solirubrobacter deserti]MDA0138067.1 ATP-binding protein [Solirubrobacter deserti]